MSFHFLIDEDFSISSSLIDTIVEDDQQQEIERSSAGSSFLRNSSDLENDQMEATTQWFEESASFQSYSSMECYKLQTTSSPNESLSELLNDRDQSDETESFSGTIWSSVPSTTEVEIRPPQIVPCHDNWAISPHPNLALRRNLSITTTESLYHDVLLIDGPNSDDISVGASIISFLSPYNESATMKESSATNSSFAILSERSSTDRIVHTHNRAAFMNVANKLLIPSNPNVGCEWFSRFTEQDWLEFRSNAKMILGALEPPQTNSTTLVLPPLAPHVNRSNVQSETNNNSIPRWMIPQDFFCSMCHDLIVGATSLSCGCATSIVCTQCWESHITVCEEYCSDGFIHVHERRQCPFCKSLGIGEPVACHALDVAIFYVVKALPDGFPIQARYYFRLNAWRDEVLRRQSQLPSFEHLASNERVLAELIQQEEEVIWKKKRTFWQTPLCLFFSEVAVAIAALSIASVGLSAISKRSR